MRALLITFALMLVAGMAFAQAGSIRVVADWYGEDCNLPAPPVPPVGIEQIYYVVYVDSPGATDVWYRAKLPDCLVANGVSVVYEAVMVSPYYQGNSQTGIWISFGDWTCRQGTIALQQINLIKNPAYPPTPPCCYWYVDANPSAPSGMVEARDCDGNAIYPTGQYGIVNAGPTCNCSVPVESRTWGGVKALYTE